jgi:hypothetical protein
MKPNVLRQHLLTFCRAAIVTTLAGAASGCSDDDDGTLQQNWTIAGTTDSNACGIRGANQVRLVVFDPGLFVQATQFAPCNAFTTSLRLRENTYTSTLTFIDVNGIAVSETRRLAAFTVTEDRTTTLNTDFAVTEFLPR